MERNSMIANVLVGAFVFGIFELFGFRSAVVVCLVIIIIALGEIAQQMQPEGPPTADDLE
jgi:hypothetical protein